MANHRWHMAETAKAPDQVWCEMCGIAYTPEHAIESCIEIKSDKSIEGETHKATWVPESESANWANQLMKDADKVAADTGRTSVDDLLSGLKLVLDAATELGEDGELKNFSNVGSELTVYVSPKDGLKRLMERFPKLKIVIIATQSNMIGSPIVASNNQQLDTMDDDGFSQFSPGT